jgi:hypothetical protein
MKGRGSPFLESQSVPQNRMAKRIPPISPGWVDRARMVEAMLMNSKSWCGREDSKVVLLTVCFFSRMF